MLKHALINIVFVSALLDANFVNGGYDKNVFLVNAEEFISEENDGDYMYENCGGRNTSVILDKIDTIPRQFVIPTNLRISIAFTITEDISGPIKINISLSKRLPLFGYVTIPCVGNYGSCSHSKACQIMDTYPKDSWAYAMACPRWFRATGIECRCPLKKGEYSSSNIKTVLDTKLVPKWIAAGDYKAVVTMENDSGEIGCFKFQIRLK